MSSITELAINGGPKTIEKPGPHFDWPIITEETEKAVIDQLRTTVSLYDRSGVFAEFEDAFSAYHGRKQALLANSGTSAIFSMFEGINLGPGDEIICPTYTFFATISPVMYTGAEPVFVDCAMDGNVNPDEIEKHITSKTKAVIVTHMWGIPCDMEAIRAMCDRRGIYLLEDCSHAHGARYKGQLVGTFGHAAAWSLQGQKVVTGGEGGIMLTDDSEILYRALLQGHYNKRCKQQVPSNHPLSKFSTTGFGQKFRAHPLAIAMAKQQFSHLDEWLHQKREFAGEFIEVLGQYPFIILPNTQEREPSWYAFVFLVDESKSNGVTAKKFDELLKSEGLIESDRPGSTSPIHSLPLFSDPHLAVPRFYKGPFNSAGRPFPVAGEYYRQAIKLPVWARKTDREIVLKYKEGLAKVCEAIIHDRVR